MSAKKLINYILKFIRFILHLTSAIYILASVFFAVTYFFVPRTYDWYIIITAHEFLEKLYLGSFSDFLKFDAIVFIIGFVTYLLSVALSRFTFPDRTE